MKKDLSLEPTFITHDWDIEGFWFGTTGNLYISCKKVGIKIEFCEGLYGYDIGISAYSKDHPNGWLARDANCLIENEIVPMPTDVLKILAERTRCAIKKKRGELYEA